MIALAETTKSVASINSEMTPREGYLLRTLEDELAMGWCELLLGSLDCMGPIRSDGSELARERLASLEVRAARMVATEAEHGSGSLLDLSHPAVAEAIGRRMMDGSSFISEDQIRAAHRYRDALPHVA